MGFRFRKSIKIAPGVRVNLGKKSAGVSIGGKYGGISVNSKTGARARVSAPGTGLSYSQKIGSSSRSRSPSSKSYENDGPTSNTSIEETNSIPTQDTLQDQLKRAKQKLFIGKYIKPLIGIFFIILGISSRVFWAIAILFFYSSFKSIKTSKDQIPLLEQQASQIGAVQDDITAICTAEEKINHVNRATPHKDILR